jgi:hypothetical protein
VTRLEGTINELKSSSKVQRFTRLQADLEVCTHFPHAWRTRTRAHTHTHTHTHTHERTHERTQEADKVKGALAAMLTGSFGVDDKALQQHLKQALFKSDRLYGASR